MTRRILLTLADDTTATECGACPRGQHLDYPDMPSASMTFCHAFRSMSLLRRRLPKCIAAEAAAARMVEPLPAGDAEHVGRDIWERGTDDGGAAERLRDAIRKLLEEP